MRFLKRGLVVLVGLSLCVAATGANAQAVGRITESGAPHEEPYLMWFLKSFGLVGLLSLLTGLAVFVGAWVVILMARRPAVIASYLVFLPLPLLFGILGALSSFECTFGVLARADVEIRQSQIFAGLAEALLLPLSALLVTLPSYFVVAIGLFVRTLWPGERSGGNL